MASVRPSIYIGIGGTGINAVAKTKKMFEDAYGKDTLPHLPVRFVCLDYDKTSATDPKNATDISDDFIKIKENPELLKEPLVEQELSSFEYDKKKDKKI